MLKESLNAFLGEFAVEATLTISGVASTISVIFDLAHDPMGLDGEGRSITALAKSIAIEAASHGDTLYIDGKTYQIVGIEPEAEGAFTELILKES